MIRRYFKTWKAYFKFINKYKNVYFIRSVRVADKGIVIVTYSKLPQTDVKVDNDNT